MSLDLFAKIIGLVLTVGGILWGLLRLILAAQKDRLGVGQDLTTIRTELANEVRALRLEDARRDVEITMAKEEIVRLRNSLHQLTGERHVVAPHHESSERTS